MNASMPALIKHHLRDDLPTGCYEKKSMPDIRPYIHMCISTSLQSWRLPISGLQR